MPSFHEQITAILPRLRTQALALTRNKTAAEDLVQDAVCNALVAQDSFTPESNFSAWMHRILHNRFISDIRKKREILDGGNFESYCLSENVPYEERLVLKELDNALSRLPDDQREALVLNVFEGMSYDELAEISGCAVGTVKSRVLRARRQLQSWLIGDEQNDTLKKPKETSKHKKGGNKLTY